MKHICFLLLVLLYGDAIANLTPECNCVEQVGSEYKAWFGFNNDGSTPVSKSIGTDNRIFGGGLNNTNGDLGQLRVFKPGTVKKAFSVKFDGSNLSWTLNGKTVTASSTTTQCAQGKIPSRPQPSYVRVNTYNDDGNPPQITTSYADGLGRNFETQLDLHGINGYDALVTGSIFDAQGRPNKTYKSFPAITDGGYIGSKDIDKKAKEYYSATGPGEDAEGYPFSEVSYYTDPLSRKSMAGGAGKDYSLDKTSGHPVRYWYFTSNCNIYNSDYDSDGFLTCNALKKLIAATPVMPSEVTEPATHVLNVVCDANGNFTQELINPVYGKTEMTWVNSKTLNNPEIIKTRNIYNIQGNIKSVIPPGTNLISPTEYFYNTLGQLIKKINPDGTIEKYEYYPTGKQKRLVYNDCSELVTIRDIFYEYDDLDRIVSVYTMVNGKKIPKVSHYYDYIENVPLQYMGELRSNVSELILKNLKGKEVATISFGETGNPLDVVSRNRVVELFSYDDEGRNIKKFIHVPGIYVHEIRYEYDLQGKIKKETVLNGNMVDIVKKYEYDELSRLTRIINENTSPPEIIASYHYDDRSLLKYRQLLTDNSYTEQNDYTLQDNLKSLSGAIRNAFSETLDYSSYFNGNISGSEYTYQAPTPVTFQYQYLYDGINRLQSVNSITGSVPTQVCNYEYDVAGRFKNKKEYSSTQSNYQYYSGNKNGIQKYTNRLRKVGTGSDRFIYDQFGSMIVDKSKNMVLQYDYRDLPVFFRFYSTMPPGVTADQWGTVLVDDDEYKGVKGSAFNDKDINDYMSYIVKKTKGTAAEIRLLSVVMMLYNAAGERVLKTLTN